MKHPVQHRNQIGIDDMAAYIPSLCLPIEALAEARDIEYAKLNKGLGLTSMALPDRHEDTASLAANAVFEIIQRNKIDPRTIGRIYMGTESSFDGSKPMASYVLQMLTAQLEEQYGKDCFLHCDVVDLTFACIGAVDALQNTLDWVRSGADRTGIVVASDIAWYDLASTGEYTQGAGAVAMLVKENPRLMAINPDWGIASQAVYDFFKPVRRLSKADLVEEVVSAQGLNGNTGSKLYGQLMDAQDSAWSDNEAPNFVLHSETPVFDGPFSNLCYQERIAQALDHFAQSKVDFSALRDWDRMIFHLPYAFQARRMYTALFLEEKMNRGELAAIEEQIGQKLPEYTDFEEEAAFQKAKGKFLRALGKTDVYRAFVQEKIEKGERASSLVGNLYTGSIWLSLMSSLEADLKEQETMEGQVLGFFAYGSGSKSKVFEGVLNAEAAQVIQQWSLMDRLEQREVISFADYVRLRKDDQAAPIHTAEGIFYLSGIDTRKGDTYGTRSYAFSPVRQEVPSA